MCLLSIGIDPKLSLSRTSKQRSLSCVCPASVLCLSCVCPASVCSSPSPTSALRPTPSADGTRSPSSTAPPPARPSLASTAAPAPPEPSDQGPVRWRWYSWPTTVSPEGALWPPGLQTPQVGQQLQFFQISIFVMWVHMSDTHWHCNESGIDHNMSSYCGELLNLDL